MRGSEFQVSWIVDRGPRSTVTVVAAVVAAALSFATSGVADDERIEGKADAPPRHVVLKHTTGGAYFVAKDLKEQYDELLDRTRRLKEQVAGEHVPTEEALIELESLTIRLEALRKEIETAKVHVSPMRAYTRTSETTFELGPERRLVVTGDLVRVVGWPGPGVKCVLEKTVYGVGVDEPAASEFDAIHVRHEPRVAADLVGRTAAEYDADDTAFRASEAGRKMTPEQLAKRTAFVKREIRDAYTPYADYQGKQVDTLQLTGLLHEEGNRWFNVRINSKDGGGAYGGDWRRHARLTIHVPPCRGVMLRGCLVGLDVENLAAPLIVTSHGSRDRDYDGTFAVRGLTGPLHLYDVPLQRLERVEGDVRIVSTVDHANSGTHHEGGRRVSYVTPAGECSVRGVTGEFSAWFGRIKLDVAGVSGRIDVRNEFGDTRLLVEGPLVETAHRVVSQAGRIDVEVAPDALGDLPVLAVVNHGTVRTNAGRDLLDDASFTSGNSVDGSRRNWRGMTTPADAGNPLASFERMSRPTAILEDRDRTPGLDLVSRSGTIVITFADSDR